MKRSVIVLTLIVVFSNLLCGQTSNTTQPRTESNIIYGMYSGLALLMDVHYPENPNGYGVLMIPGSGWHASLSYQASQLKHSIRDPFHGAFFKRLVDAGYTVFVINHRAAPRFRFPAAVDDAQRAVRFIRHNAKRFVINPDRIGGVGYSSGGHLICMLGVLDGKGDNADPDLVNRETAKLQSVVCGGTPSDFMGPLNVNSAPVIASFLGMVVPPWQTSKTTEEYKTYRNASPIAHVTPDDAPLLLIHGDAEEVIPFQQAELMLEAEKKAGVSVRLVRIPGGKHVDLKTKDAPDYLGEMIGWHDQHLRLIK
jgi:acetyl esterase/lipase